MIPYLATCPNPNDVGYPSLSLYDAGFLDMSFLDEITAMHDSQLEKLISTDFPDFPSCEEAFAATSREDCAFNLMNEDIYDKVMRYNCKWSGCDEECAKNHLVNICIDPEDVMDLFNPNDICSQTVVLPVEEVVEEVDDDIPPYTPDNDHSYYALPSKQTFIEQDDKLNVLKKFPTPPVTSDSQSETSSDPCLIFPEDEVDVVTVPEEYHAPVVSKYDYLPRRSSRSPRYTKSVQRAQKSQLSARSLKAAMKRTRIQSVRRPYRRRKIHNSVETTPASSVPSSAHSSRCNSDVEDIDKRRTHNSSERKRREAQRTALQNLRVVIPDLQNNPKAPKVLILNTATSLVKKLKQNKRTLKDLKHRELQKKKDLLAKLQMLQMKLKR